MVYTLEMKWGILNHSLLELIETNSFHLDSQQEHSFRTGPNLTNSEPTNWNVRLKLQQNGSFRIGGWIRWARYYLSNCWNNFDLGNSFLTFGNAFCSNKTSNKLGMTLGVLQIRNMMVIPIEAFVILASLFRTRLSPPWCILRPSLSRKIPWELGRLWFRALLKPGFLKVQTIYYYHTIIELGA